MCKFSYEIKHFYIRPQRIKFFQNVINDGTDLITRISDRRDKFSELIEKEWAAHTTSLTGNFYPVWRKIGRNGDRRGMFKKVFPCRLREFADVFCERCLRSN